MARNKAKQQDDQPQGAPDWMVTFSDCMTLLLTFFVLMISYSNFQPTKFRNTTTAISEELEKIRFTDTVQKEAIVTEEEILETQPTKNTTDTPRNTVDKTTNALSVKMPTNFQNMKVFSSSSKNFFIANSMVLSEQGKELIEAMSVFLVSNPSRIIISEFANDSSPQELGYNRAIAIAEYMMNQGVSQGSINISSLCLGANTQDYRTVEITVLERNLYN